MSESIYLHILILCGILCQGIIATSDEDTEASSDFLVRKRRAMNRIPGRQIIPTMQDPNFIVRIKENGFAHCAGTIITRYNVLTVDSCFRLPLKRYTVHSNSDRVHHNIQSKAITYGSPPHHKESEGIAMLTVNPIFVFSRTTQFLNLHIGPISPGEQVIVFSSTCALPTQSPAAGTYRPQRSTILPNRNCQNFPYGFPITTKHLCTYSPVPNCSINDAGAPLVVNNTLAAIQVSKMTFTSNRKSDVYLSINRPDYTGWILGVARRL